MKAEDDGFPDSPWRVNNVTNESSLVQWGPKLTYVTSGEQAVCIYDYGNAGGSISQSVFVKPSQSYIAKVNFRTASDLVTPEVPSVWGNTADAQNAYFAVKQFGVNGNQIGNELRVVAQETGDWENLEIPFITNPNTVKVSVIGGAYMLDSYYANLGRAVFDDFKLTGPVPTVGNMKTLPDGTSVLLRNKVAGNSRPGYVLDIQGKVQTINGEKMITSPTSTQTGYTSFWPGWKV